MRRLFSRKRTRGRRRGQAYVEFIVVLPGVMLLTLLAWEFAYFWWCRMVVSTATFEATRQVATGETVDYGYAMYDTVLGMGMGELAADHSGGISLIVQPELRSVRGQASVPYHWPGGLSALMGGDMDLSLTAGAFFRLEEAQFGPPTGPGFE